MDDTKTKAGPTVWGYSGSYEPEKWGGSCATREEAIAEGRATYGDNETFYVTGGHGHDAAQFLPGTRWITESMADSAHDEVGEAAGDFPDVSDEARAELDELLRAWARKNAPCRFWTAIGAPEKIEPVEPATAVPPPAVAGDVFDDMDGGYPAAGPLKEA